MALSMPTLQQIQNKAEKRNNISMWFKANSLKLAVNKLSKKLYFFMVLKKLQEGKINQSKIMQILWILASCEDIFYNFIPNK